MGERMLLCTRKGLFLAERRREGWRPGTPSFLGAQTTVALSDPRGAVLYAALHHGHFGDKLQRSTDGGRTWQEVAAPQFPEPPEDAILVNAQGKPWPWTVQLIWCLESDPRHEGGLWCGTIPGGLFHSTDGGESWSLVRSLWDRPERDKWFGGGYDLPGIHSIAVDPRDPERLHVAISCGGVWHSRDGGASWELGGKGLRAAYMPPEQAGEPYSQDPHRLVACAADPDRLWMQHHNGIFVSRDGGGSWQEIAEAGPSTFGFSCAVDPDDPDSAWFVPAVKDECRVPPDGRLVVTRTRDGGGRFETLGQGLPQSDCYDLVYRHALDVAAGGRLAFGTTGGALWTSDDGGESWKAAALHLPPIYAVRFF